MDRIACRLIYSVLMHGTAAAAQALLVSEELIRVAILWHEKWHEALEEASRLYFGDNNVDGMFAVLAPLHEEISNGIFLF